MIWLLSCEHYTNGLPLKYAHRFVKAVDVLESPRGYDVRVAPLYLRVEPLFDESTFYRYSRLLIEPDKSIGDKFLFSPFTLNLPSEERSELISKYYIPYRNKVEDFIRNYLNEHVLHISLRSFPVQSGNHKNDSEIGISFGDSETGKEVSTILKRLIKEAAPNCRVRFNYPKNNEDDGLLNHMRNEFPTGYVGIKLSVRNDIILELRPSIYSALANLRGILG